MGGPKFKRNWRIMLYGLGLMLVVCLVWAMISNCDDVLRVFGNLLGYGSGILVILRFIPQLVRICKESGSGGLSKRAYFFMTFGGFLANYFQIFVSGESLTTWGPV